ncbi:SURF1 family protein [Nostocoides sp. HKS02]|uniref:SURF1 family protein n=1 Tax=Nostocoides sp. HKS02 TaxID=1813880 RepID=UPI0012B4E48A|nr:SURF1 family protein [Tetrasphaera sp. HKS02]QGN59252.1 SURF1 family protein [Tetrasphaera sp. HKS02]
MLRTALKPRWLGLFALLVALVVTFVQLGLWQLHVAEDKGLADSLRAAHDARPAVVDTVITPHQPFPNPQSGRTVTAVGRYAASDQLVVGPRRLDGRSGYWVVTPLDVASSGARLVVVRGFVTSLTAVGLPPTGQVTVDGSLAPGESPADAPAGLPVGAPPALGSIDLSILVNRWPTQLYNAFVFAQSERSATGADVTPAAGLQRVPPPQVGGGLKWRNAAYAVQWWMFAAFAAFMWFRMVRDDAARD